MFVRSQKYNILERNQGFLNDIFNEKLRNIKEEFARQFFVSWYKKK